MTYQPDATEDEDRHSIQKVVLAWLSKSNATPTDLLALLRGDGLPPVAYDDEPYLTLLRGLPLGLQRVSAERQMAVRLNPILADNLALALSAERAKQVVFNALCLAAALRRPDELSEALNSIYVGRSLAGSWAGTDLRASLRLALSANQIDSHLYPAWKSMFMKGSHPFLVGSYVDGWYGVLYMPPSASERGKPSVGSLKVALRALIGHFASDRVRRQSLLQELLQGLFSVYPGDWRPRLSQWATDDWPPWARNQISASLSPAENPLSIFGASAQYVWDPAYVFANANV